MSTYGLERISRTIPHRTPILLVDRVTEVVVGERMTTRKAVSANEPVYAGLAGEAADYAYPIPLVVESWAQSAVLLAVWECPNPDVLAGKVELAGSIKEIAVEGQVFPGQVIEHHVQLVKSIGGTAILAGEARVEGAPLLRVGSFVVALRDVSELPTPTLSIPAPAHAGALA
ncbi:3-hydroxyacyl-ACP dehydratase FabZ family protein [Salinispora sp. H7-4]|uniref:3-hydroxyacyl-ACP dehydratase FabZ family protein n=1 Tax=Salinispora sp. H7-4 TaxID=2748321 RepID=UPI0015D1DDB5|nr:3-hydroxyacyl-ACP dehydratase [Salinispora sp. H7-4]NYT96272.1 3-hydroxyacyl-ACP dehydratase [Salinispora sp. H7-4]